MARHLSPSRSTDAAPRRSLREENAAETRELLLSTALAVIERGEEPTMRTVAKEARVGERTIYRYFESRDALANALMPKFIGRAGVPLCARFDGLEQYTRDLFSTFDANRQLNIALLTSSWAAKEMLRSRRKHLLDLRKLVDEAFPHAPAEERAAATSALRASLSGSGWLYLCVSCDIPLKDAIAHVQWLIRLCADRLKRASRKS